MFAKLVYASFVINPKKFQFFWIDLSSNLYSLFCKGEKTESTFLLILSQLENLMVMLV